MESLGTVDKAIDVLFHLHEEAVPCGVSAIGRSLGMPKSSVHRLLSALTRRGMVERDDRGLYRPGIGLVALGLGALEREPSVIAARPVLERFAEEIGETFFLVGARAGALIVLEKAEGTGVLRVAPRVGERVPIHATAVGKLYLALAPDVLGDLGTAPLPNYTPSTLTDREVLEREVAAVRVAGFARNRDEWVPGLTVLAAPVWLGDRVAAAVAIALATSSLGTRSTSELEARVRAAAAAIGARMNGTAPGS